MNEFRWCRNCPGGTGAPGYPHEPECPRPKYHGDPDDDATEARALDSAWLGESCGSCGADVGPSESFPWHLASEDCRAIRSPGAA